MRFKRLPVLPLLCTIVVLAIALAGCTAVAPTATTGSTESASGTTAESASAESAPAEPTTLDVYTWWDITNFAHLQQMQASFEEQNPDIKLNFITIPTDYANTMVTKLAAGEVPDVMMLAMDQVPRYANAGLITPIADLASQEYIDALYPVVKNALSVDGTMFAAGRDVTPKVMYLNTALFDAAGIPIPADTWTIDDFLALAQQLTTGTGVNEQWGYYWANYPDQTFALIAAFGGHMYSEDGTHSVLSTDEKSMQALQFMYDLYNTYDVAPTAAEAAQFGAGEYAPFMANKVAMQIGSLSTASALDAAGTQYTVLPIPYIDGVSQTSSFVNTWTIPANAEHPDLSWRAVEFLSGKEGQQIALDMKFGLPASTLVDTAEFEAATPYNKYYVQALDTAVPYPVHPNGSAFQQLFITEAEKLWAGVSTPETFATTMDEASTEILNPEQ